MGKFGNSWAESFGRVQLNYHVFTMDASANKLDTGNRNRNDLYKARAKLVIGNLLTGGLINLFFAVSNKIMSRRKAVRKGVQTKLELIAAKSAPVYGLDYLQLKNWLYYFFGTESKEPDVTPFDGGEFYYGWCNFYDDNYDSLKSVAKEFKLRVMKR